MLGAPARSAKRLEEASPAARATASPRGHPAPVDVRKAAACRGRRRVRDPRSAAHERGHRRAPLRLGREPLPRGARAAPDDVEVEARWRRQRQRLGGAARGRFRGAVHGPARARASRAPPHAAAFHAPRCRRAERPAQRDGDEAGATALERRLARVACSDDRSARGAEAVGLRQRRAAAVAPAASRRVRAPAGRDPRRRRGDAVRDRNRDPADERRAARERPARAQAPVALPRSHRDRARRRRERPPHRRRSPRRDPHRRGARPARRAAGRRRRRGDDGGVHPRPPQAVSSRRSARATSRSMRGLGRFRVNVARQRTGLKVALRLIAPRDPDARSRSACRPSIAARDAPPPGPRRGHRPDRPRQDDDARGARRLINRETTHHIITVEDPVEYVHPRKTRDDEPARGRHAHALVRERRSRRRCARIPTSSWSASCATPRRCAWRSPRARPATSCIGDDEHAERGQDDRPPDRPLPARATSSRCA